MHERPEAELIDQSRQGHQDSIAELFQRHYPASLKLACGILRHNDDAQDAVQVAYFLAFRRLDNFRGDASFKTWISRIVVNLLPAPTAGSAAAGGVGAIGGSERVAGTGPNALARAVAGEVGLVPGTFFGVHESSGKTAAAFARDLHAVRGFRIVVAGGGGGDGAKHFRDEDQAVSGTGGAADVVAAGVEREAGFCKWQIVR
jgi:hypothetical protein